MKSDTPYDLVFLDNEMPVMRGRDCVKHARLAGYTGLVVGLTGNVLMEDLEDFKSNGADEVIMKPMTPGMFKQVIALIQSRTKHTIVRHASTHSA